MRFLALKRMAEAAASRKSVPEVKEVVTDGNNTSWVTNWKQFLRWSPTSRNDIIEAEQRLLSLVKTPYVQEQVNIGSGPPGSKVRWFGSASTEPRFINTVSFDEVDPDAPTLVMVHGYGASQGFFLRNFDALAQRFRVLAIDQIGWGASSRPDFTCTSTEETESWFVDSLEEWRKAKNLDKFILLGHSLGGYVAARYALKHPEHVEHLILVGPVGFASEVSERLTAFRKTWKGAFANYLWESNFTPQKIVRYMGPWGPNIVRRYTGARFGTHTSGAVLDEQEASALSDYIFHTVAAPASGELCLKYLFAFGAFARSPLFTSAPQWKVPTSFIYGVDDWVDYRGAQAACQLMKVQTEVIRVPQGGHFVFLDNAPLFHSAVEYACRRFFKDQSSGRDLPEELWLRREGKNLSGSKVLPCEWIPSPSGSIDL